MIYSNFVLIDRLLFELSYKTQKHETQKHRNTETHTDSDEYSVVAFCKNATRIKIASSSKDSLTSVWSPSLG